MEPNQKYSRRAHGKRKESKPDLEDEIRKDASLRNVESQGSEHKNPTHIPKSSDKVTEETALLADTEKCQPEAMPSGASPDLMCKSHILSNITHEPVKASTQRDSHGIPQISTEESPQGTDQIHLWQTPVPMGRAKGDPLVFVISTNSIKKLTKRLLGSNPRRPPNKSPVTLTTNSRSFDKILESVVNNLPKITLLEREDEPPRYIAKEETSTKNTDEASETFDSSEIQRKTTKPISVRKNPLYRRKSKMASSGHPENFRPQQPMGNTNQIKNNQEELVHKQKANNANPFASYGPTTHPNLRNNTQTPTNNAQPNKSMTGMQGSNTSGSMFSRSTLPITKYQ
eukprot:Gb_05199 [translate_table: standard]